MPISPLLAPVVALVAWTLLVMIWMLIARGREFRRLGINLGNIPDGARGVDLEGKAEPAAQWKSHNYNHLMEQPTIFYALAFLTYLLGLQSPMTAGLAWIYVGLRIVHSLVQVTVNLVPVRFLVFALSTIALAVWTGCVALDVIGS